MNIFKNLDLKQKMNIGEEIKTLEDKIKSFDEKIQSMNECKNEAKEELKRLHLKSLIIKKRNKRNEEIDFVIGLLELASQGDNNERTSKACLIAIEKLQNLITFLKS